MRVLLLGATGNLGSRLLPALIQRGHTVTVFVRNPSKLATGVQRDQFTIECGDAKKATEIKAAASKHQCDAIVNAAGLAAVAPWGSSDLPAIIDAVVRAALELGQERGKPLRLWVLAGLGILELPTTKYMLVD
jgi:nucleoside-diphosphate-sugar epimerase